ncbi:ABC transporter ATP-binding protein [Kibdelosporangium aridum]|uniref:ABC-type multidrug transport system, ATPase component n=1 Tax=Kibdelosporangium aridum TaxID=2030 RepID=A0A1W2CYU6_KIBAR|nr:ABC transporter ATP-binding protein [Kibdelosporangium aridum]SMC90363.1 ABC-type multidrug transport system, ATPase component [Kibdelosporangium aridum]
MLQVTGIHKAYGPRKVLKGLDFGAQPGELVGIVGENGAGKTTLLRILCGELAPDDGSVRLTGTPGYCPQQPVLNPELTVEQHLRYFQVAHKLSTLDRAGELIEQLGFQDYRATRVKHLSGGTQQKLNLVLALMHDPSVVLLDEPYQGFDWDTYLRFWDIAAALRTAGKTVVVISHLAYDAERLDTLYRLRDGLLETTRSRV